MAHVVEAVQAAEQTLLEYRCASPRLFCVLNGAYTLAITARTIEQMAKLSLCYQTADVARLHKLRTACRTICQPSPASRPDPAPATKGVEAAPVDGVLNPAAGGETSK